VYAVDVYKNFLRKSCKKHCKKQEQELEKVPVLARKTEPRRVIKVKQRTPHRATDARRANAGEQINAIKNGDLAESQ
jgi:hypothetical protein